MITTAERVRARIAEVLGIDVGRIARDDMLRDLVVESFVLVELAIELQEEFRVGMSQQDLRVVHTVSDLVALIESRC